MNPRGFTHSAPRGRTGQTALVKPQWTLVTYEGQFPFSRRQLGHYLYRDPFSREARRPPRDPTARYPQRCRVARSLAASVCWRAERSEAPDAALAKQSRRVTHRSSPREAATERAPLSRPRCCTSARRCAASSSETLPPSRPALASPIPAPAPAPARRAACPAANPNARPLQAFQRARHARRDLRRAAVVQIVPQQARPPARRSPQPPTALARLAPQPQFSEMISPRGAAECARVVKRSLA